MKGRAKKSTVRDSASSRRAISATADMAKYEIGDLVDLAQLRTVFEKFTKATGFTIGFLDHPGKDILIATGWRDICTKFHRACPAAAKACLKSNARLLDNLKRPGQIIIEKCDHGMVDCATPILINGRHIASLATGQLLLHKPDLVRFRRQARKFGFDEKKYLAALRKVPVMDAAKVKQATAFLGEIARLISELGLAHLHSKERADTALRESETRLEQVLNNSLDMVYRRNLQTDSYDYISPSCMKLIGNTPREIIGQGVCAMLPRLHPDDVPRVRKTLHKAQTSHLKNGLLEYRIRHTDGRYRWLSDRFTIQNDAGGRPLYWLGVSRDITDAKRLEQALLESEARHRTLFAQAADAIVVFDPDTLHILDFNDEACQQRGYTRAEFSKLSIPDLDVIQAASLIKRLCRQIVRTGAAVFETRQRTKNGKVLDIEVRSKPIQVGGRVLIQAIWRDITD